MYSMPNGEQHQGGVECEGESADMEYEDDNEDDSEEVGSPPHSE